MVKKGIPPILMNWAWERENKESGIVPHFSSLDNLTALRKRLKRPLKTEQQRDALEQYALISKGANRSKDRKRKKK